MSINCVEIVTKGLVEKVPFVVSGLDFRRATVS